MQNHSLKKPLFIFTVEEHELSFSLEWYLKHIEFAALCLLWCLLSHVLTVTLFMTSKPYWVNNMKLISFTGLLTTRDEQHLVDGLRMIHYSRLRSLLGRPPWTRTTLIIQNWIYFDILFHLFWVSDNKVVTWN